MARESASDSDLVSRRKIILGTGAAGAAMLAGCSSGGDGNGNSSNDGQGQGNTGNGAAGSMDTTTLTADGSSTVYPITSTGGSYWNSNPEAGDGDYWPSEWAEEYGTEMRLADYFAQQYGYEATNSRSEPPFRASIALSHSGTGIEGVMEERVDIGDASATAEAELSGSDVSQDELDNFVDHVVGVDGQPLVTSAEIADSGVESITIEELRDIYRQEITNWSELGGPDRDILALGRAENSGTATSFRTNVFGDPNASTSPDQRFGQNQQLQQAVSQADNAIAYIALAFVEPDGGTPPIDLVIDGTTYSYGDNLGAEEYPLSRDLHAYTWEDTSRKEACFINFLLSDFGQETFVAGNNYFQLPSDRLETQREMVAASNYE